jgi:hypothetical protein
MANATVSIASIRSVRAQRPATALKRFATSISPTNFGLWPVTVVRDPRFSLLRPCIRSENTPTDSYMPLAISSAVWPTAAMDATDLIAPALLLSRIKDDCSTGMRLTKHLTSSSGSTCLPSAKPDAMADVRNESIVAVVSRQTNHSGPPTSVAMGS